MSVYADRIRQLEEEGNRLRKEITNLIDEASEYITFHQLIQICLTYQSFVF